MQADDVPTAALFRFTLPIPVPSSAIVRTDGVPIYNQRGFPTCTAAATAALLQLAGATVDTQVEEVSIAFLYLAGRLLVTKMSTAAAPILIENQVEGGLPLAASVQALCLYGAISRNKLPHPDDPTLLQKWMDENNHTVESLSKSYADLPGDLRALRLYPSLSSLKASILGGKAIAFAFRIGPVIDKWMQKQFLSRGVPTLPPLDDTGPRLATHACVLVGYDDARDAFLVRNSFGQNWGLFGHYWANYTTVMRHNFSGSEFYALG